MFNFAPGANAQRTGIAMHCNAKMFLQSPPGCRVLFLFLAVWQLSLVSQDSTTGETRHLSIDQQLQDVRPDLNR